MWVVKWRYNYRKFLKSNGKYGNRERMKRLESLGLLDDTNEENKAIKPDEVISCLPEVVTSLSDKFESSTKKTTSSSTARNMVEERDIDNVGVSTAHSDLDFLGSELRGGFWA